MKTKSKSIGYAHQRGDIQESAIKALVTDKLFRCRVERNHKGKGSYQRNAKHRKGCDRGENPFKSVHVNIFKWVLFLYGTQLPYRN
ncbi:alternative ribosome-rescue factor A [Pasteurellaceae bacterium 15-036681]|nr:alternative ribosome-rescue factor A [Pasteurellaceae bacterium 15-036681]